jgi:hypothetical protein
LPGSSGSGPAFAARIVTGSTADDLHIVADADWIVEAVAEKLDIKQALYRKIDAVRKPGSILSSNTSIIPIAALLEGLPESLAADFLITHFFNPPRRMRLLEMAEGPKTRPEAGKAIRDFADRALGKEVVVCKDTPGFIANRIGSYWVKVTQNEAIRLGLRPIWRSPPKGTASIRCSTARGAACCPTARCACPPRRGRHHPCRPRAGRKPGRGLWLRGALGSRRWRPVPAPR